MRIKVREGSELCMVRHPVKVMTVYVTLRNRKGFGAPSSRHIMG